MNISNQEKQDLIQEYNTLNREQLNIALHTLYNAAEKSKGMMQGYYLSKLQVIEDYISNN